MLLICSCQLLKPLSTWLQRKNISTGEMTGISKKENKAKTNPRGTAFHADEGILRWQTRTSSHPALLLHSLTRFLFFLLLQAPLNLYFLPSLYHFSLSLHFSLLSFPLLMYIFLLRLLAVSLWLHPSSLSTLTVILYLRVAWQANAQSDPLVPFPQQRSSLLRRI